ncbi:phosphoserine phosphatase SerB [Shewanella gaetbuli]
MPTHSTAVNTPDESILNWLYSSSEAQYMHQGILCKRYIEAEYRSVMSNENCSRFRVIFEQQAKVDIASWLNTLAQKGHFCRLERQNSLLGFEVIVQEEPAQLVADFNAIKTTKNLAVELLMIDQPLPNLNEQGLLVMDMDSTAIQIECIDELAAMAGVGEEVAAVTASAMRGELDFEQSLRLRVSKLANADAKIIDELCQKLPLMPGLTDSLQELQLNQWKLVVASGGFTPFVNYLMHQLKLNAAFANELVIEDGKLTGEVTGDVVDAQYKANVIQRCAQKWQIPPTQTVAIGDGANDIPMIEAAKLGIAFHGKPKLINAADLAVNQLDLRALVFCLQA